MSVDRRPLIVSTRREAPDGRFAVAIRRCHGRLWELPMTRTVMVPNASERLAEVLANGTWSWLAVTSARVARVVASAMRRSGRRNRLEPTRVVAVGRTTAAALRNEGVDVSPTVDVWAQPSGRALARHLLSSMVDPRLERVLWPRGSVSLPDVADVLRAAGVQVIAPVLYETLPSVPKEIDLFRDGVERGRVHSVCFFAPSAVRSAAAAFGPTVCNLLASTRVGTMGPATSQALRQYGVEPSIEARAADVTLFGLAVASHEGTTWGARP